MANAKDTKDAPTGHKQESAPVDAGGGGNPDGSLPMGMTGNPDAGGDPDQKSTHNAPKTVQSNLPDGSPKFADPSKKAGKAKAGKYEVLSRVATMIDGKKKTLEPGETHELEAEEAASLGDSVKPV